MSTHREVLQKKTTLLQDLRAATQAGDLVLGEMAPSVRELAAKYGLSKGVVTQQIQILIQEGLFHTVAGTGTFVGPPQPSEHEFYLFIKFKWFGGSEMPSGFEAEIARRGGTTLVMDENTATEQLRLGSLPPLSGVFVYWSMEHALRTELNKLTHPRGTGRLPEVNHVVWPGVTSYADRVYFDYVSGGRQAAQHLMSRSHERIAYLGIHAPDNALKYEWSVERMEGWRSAMISAGLPWEDLAYLPRRLAIREDWPSMIQEVCRRLLHDNRATAVVTANDETAIQLMDICRAENIPPSRWPAIVSFDDTLPAGRYVLSSLRMPWDELGRVAASLLWQRAHGQLADEPVCQLVSPRMIPRLSCRANWSLAASLQTVS